MVRSCHALAPDPRCHGCCRGSGDRHCSDEAACLPAIPAIARRLRWPLQASRPAQAAPPLHPDLGEPYHRFAEPLVPTGIALPFESRCGLRRTGRSSPSYSGQQPSTSRSCTSRCGGVVMARRRICFRARTDHAHPDRRSSLVAGGGLRRPLFTSSPRELSHLWVLGAAGAVGSAGNQSAAVVRLRAGRRLDGAGLVVDGYHACTDGLVSLGVMVSALLVAL